MRAWILTVATLRFTVGMRQENVRRGIQEDRKLAKLISAIEAEIEKNKSEQ